MRVNIDIGAATSFAPTMGRNHKKAPSTFFSQQAAKNSRGGTLKGTAESRQKNPDVHAFDCSAQATRDVAYVNEDGVGT
eukprot:5404722-Amphidinium_carterae.1